MNDRVVVVTGASRGIGKSIACALGRAGATVYVTGRGENGRESRFPGTIAETAANISAAGGHGIAVVCDHADDGDVSALIARVADERGRLDLLVNNAAAFGDTPDGYPQEVPFWDLPVTLWDVMMRVGLRSHFVAARQAAPLMIAQRSGLIVNVSSAGAAAYAFNAGYGAVKAGIDKLTADMATDLRPHGVAALSLWPPFTLTEKYLAQAATLNLSAARAPDFTGQVVARLAADPDVMEKSGRTMRATELATAYGLAM